MKIAVNSSIYERTETGVPLYVKNLYTTLQNLYPEHQYLFFQTENKKTLGKTFFKKILNGKISLFIFNYFLIKKLIQKVGCVDIFHGPAHTLPFFKIKNTIHILTIHDVIFKKIPEQTSLFFRTYHNFLLKRNLKKADHIIAVSKNTAQDIIDIYNIPKSKITTIYEGIHQSFIDPELKKRIIKDVYFLSVVTHPQRKNIHGVLQALALSSKLKDYTYVITGSLTQKEIEKIILNAQKLGVTNKIVFKGYVDQQDLISLYQHAEFLIYPSLYEGFGFPILEAFSCKCPVITSDTSSLPELMPHKEWLVNPHNPEDIAQKMELLMAISIKQKEELIQNNLLFSKKFTWKKTADETMRLFKSLI